MQLKLTRYLLRLPALTAALQSEVHCGYNNAVINYRGSVALPLPGCLLLLRLNDRQPLWDSVMLINIYTFPAFTVNHKHPDGGDGGGVRMVEFRAQTGFHLLRDASILISVLVRCSSNVLVNVN